MKKIKPALLKKFVLEFESIVNKANSKFEEDKNIDDYMVELSKAVGLTASISHESQMLMLELMEEIQTVIAPGSPVIKTPLPPKAGLGGIN